MTMGMASLMSDFLGSPRRSFTPCVGCVLSSVMGAGSFWVFVIVFCKVVFYFFEK